MSYIGKIAAVVTANTSDLSRKLRGSKQEVEGFSRSVNATLMSITRNAGKSLSGIYTPRQRQEQAVRAGLGFGIRDQKEAQFIRQIARAAEQVAGPLGAAQKQIAGLSNATQNAFKPVLTAAQREVERLFDSIAKGTKHSSSDFASLARYIGLAKDAAARIGDAGNLAGRLATGKELRFAMPGVSRELERAASLQNQSGDVPTDRMGRVASIVDAQRRAAARVETQVAKVEAAKRQTPADEAAALKALDRTVAALAKYNDQLAKEIALEAAVAAAAKKTAEARAAATAARQDVAFAVSGKAQNVGQAEQEYARVTAAVKQLDAAQRKAFAPNLRTLGQLIAKGDEAKLTDIRKLLAAIDRDLAKQSNLDIKTEDAKRKLQDIQASLKAISVTLTGRSSDPFDRLADSANRAKQAVDKVSDARRKASLEGRIGRIEAANAADAARSDLSPRQLARRAASRAGQLDVIADSAEQKTATDIFGAPLRSSAQRLDALKTRIQSLQSSLAELPGPLQSGLIPKLNAARREFAALGASATPAQIRAAARAADDLEKGLKRAAAAAQFRGTFKNFLDTTAADRYAAKLAVIQGAMAAVGATASGPVASAINKYRKALQDAAASGTLGADATARRMSALAASIAEVAVQTGKMSKAQAAAFLASVRGAGIGGRNVGDIGRFGADKIQLGIQQAAFAFEDFFSVTGDLSQRVRAAGNNISQLGYILGGTEGLILGISAAIGAQLVAAFVRWYTNGAKVEAQTKALNDSLERQKSSVEALAQAYRALSSEIGKSGQTKSGRRELEIREQVEEIQRKAQERNKEETAALSPDVARIRAERGLLEDRLSKEGDIEKRVRIQAEIDRSKREEERAVSRGLPRPTREQIGAELDAAEQAALRQSQVRLNRAKLRETLGGVAPPGEDVASLEAELARRQESLNKRRAAGAGATAPEQLRELRDSLKVLEEQRAAVVRLQSRGESVRTDEIDKAIDDVSVSIRRLESSLAPEVQAVADKFNESALRLASDLDDLAESAIELGSDALGRAVKAIADREKELQDQIAAATTVEQATALRDQLSQLELQTQALKDQRNAAEAASDAVQKFAEVLDRARQEAQQNLQQAQSDADAARRAQLGVSTPRSREERSEAERSLERQRESNARVEREVSLARERFKNEVASGGNTQGSQMQRDAARVAEIDRLLSSAGVLAPGERERLIEERAEIESRVVSQDPQVAAARDADTRIRRQEELAARGRELRMTPAQKAAEQYGNDAAAINQSFMRDFGGGLRAVANVRERNAAVSRLAEEAAQSVAPTLMGFREERLNAALQGPSRAALNVADTQTMEGQRELNRLLRGDDPAKDVNLQELKTQTEKLDAVIQAIKDNAPGAIVEFRG